MGQDHFEYLLGRHEQEMAAAAASSNKAARLAHFELAYRYSIAIAHTSVANYESSKAVSSVSSAELGPRGVSATTAVSDKHVSETTPVSRPT
jgi:hypothetical protein